MASRRVIKSSVTVRSRSSGDQDGWFVDALGRILLQRRKVGLLASRTKRICDLTCPIVVQTLVTDASR